MNAKQSREGKIAISHKEHQRAKLSQVMGPIHIAWMLLVQSLSAILLNLAWLIVSFMSRILIFFTFSRLFLLLRCCFFQPTFCVCFFTEVFEILEIPKNGTVYRVPKRTSEYQILFDQKISFLTSEDDVKLPNSLGKFKKSSKKLLQVRFYKVLILNDQ